MQMKKFICSLARATLSVMAALLAVIGLVVGLLIHTPETIETLLHIGLIVAGIFAGMVLIGTLACGIAACRRAKKAQHA